MFFFLLVSAVCSAVQELGANAFRLRAKKLEEALNKVLRDPKSASAIFNHPLLAGLKSPRWLLKGEHNPSYIPTEGFARAVLDLYQSQRLPAGAAVVVNKLLGNSGQTIDQQRAVVEKWFDDSMDRASGWYKRTAHAWLWAIAIVVCGFLNADAFMLSKIFWNDEALRGSMVAAATKYVQENGKNKPEPDKHTGTGAQAQAERDNKKTDREKKGSRTGSSNGNKSTTGTDAEKAGKQANPGSSPSASTDAKGSEQKGDVETTKTDNASTSSTGTSAGDSSEEVFNRLKKVRSQLEETGVPIGWCWLEAEGDSQYVKCLPQISSPAKPESTSQGAKSEGTGGKDTVRKDEEKPQDKKDKEKQAGEAGKEEPRMVPKDGGGWIIKILGILISALAVSQGSPFWFDLLSKTTNIRLAGQKPDGAKK